MNYIRYLFRKCKNACAFCSCSTFWYGNLPFLWIPRNLLPFYEKNIMATWFKPISLQDTLVLIFYDLWCYSFLLDQKVYIYFLLSLGLLSSSCVKCLKLGLLKMWGYLLLDSGHLTFRINFRKVVFRSSSYFTRVTSTRLTFLHFKFYILVSILVSTNRLFIELDRQAANQIRRPEWWIEFGRVVSLLEPLTIDP